MPGAYVSFVTVLVIVDCADAALPDTVTASIAAVTPISDVRIIFEKILPTAIIPYSYILSRTSNGTYPAEMRHMLSSSSAVTLAMSFLIRNSFSSRLFTRPKHYNEFGQISPQNLGKTQQTTTMSGGIFVLY